MVANFETGSCPFLYTRHEGEPDLLKVGRVLKSASSPYNPGVYEASFDGSLREIVIQEEELETTYLSKVSLVGRDIHGVVLDHVSVSDVSLGIGGALTLRPARTEHVASYELRIEGYYVPIGSALLEAASRDRMAP